MSPENVMNTPTNYTLESEETVGVDRSRRVCRTLTTDHDGVSKLNFHTIVWATDLK